MPASAPSDSSKAPRSDTQGGRRHHRRRPRWPHSSICRTPSSTLHCSPCVLTPDEQIDRLAALIALLLSGGGIAPSFALGPAGGFARLLGGLALGLAPGVGAFGVVVAGIVGILAVKYGLLLLLVLILICQTNIQPPDLVAHGLHSLILFLPILPPILLPPFAVTALAARADLIPHLLPLFAPRERSVTDDADLLGQILLLHSPHFAATAATFAGATTSTPG